MQRRIETKSKICRFLITFSCILFGMFIVYNINLFKSMMVHDVIPYVYQHMNGTSVEIANINTSFNKILTNNDEIEDVVLYKFVTDNTNSEIIKGQLGITSQSRDGRNVLSNGIYSVKDNKLAFQEILLNKVHYENVTSIMRECAEFFNSNDTFTCRSVKSISVAYKTVVTIPISDTDGYSVIGYILLTLNREYDNDKVSNVVRGIQAHIPDVKASMEKI